MNEFNVVGLYEHNAAGYRDVKRAFINDNVVGTVRATGTGKTYMGLNLVYDNQNLKTLWLFPSNAIIEHVKKVIDDNPNLDMERDFSHVEFRTYQSLINMSRAELAALDIDLLVLDEFHHIGAPVWGTIINTIIETHPNIKIFGMTAYTVRDRGTSYERDMANPDGNELFSNRIVGRYDLVDAMIDGVLPKPIYRSAYINLMGVEQQLEEKVKKLNASSREYQEYMSILSSARKRIAEAPGIADVVKKYVKSNGKYIYFCPPYSEDGVNDIETIKREAMKWFKAYIPEEDIVFYTSTSNMKDSGKSNREAFYNDVDLDGNNVDGKLRIMFAINQYNEGVHAPNIDGVIMGRGTASDIVFFEELGRALSVRGNTFKKFNEYSNYSIEQLRDLCIGRDINITSDMAKEEIIERLIAPTIIDLAGNISFIKTLENNLRDRIKDIQRSETGAKRKIKIRDASFDIDIVNEDLFEILEYLRDRLTCTWNDYYELAKEYYREYDNLQIPKNFKTINGYEYDENGVNLGSWIRSQRIAYKNRSLSKEKRMNGYAPLTDEQVTLLENIGMAWDAYSGKWNKMYKLAKEYYGHYGNLEVPQGFKTQNGYEYNENGVYLGKWIGTQRKAYKNRSLSKEYRTNNSAPLTDEQVTLLENIGMVWDVHTEKWMLMYKLAQEYHREYGNLQIPDDFKTINGYKYNEDGVSLGKWIGNQRMAYKNRGLSEENRLGRGSPLTDEQVTLLENIGMVWDAYIEKWMQMYKLAKEYYKEHGNLQIPGYFKTINGYEYNENGVNLGSWIGTQRKAYKNRSLSEENRLCRESPLTDEQVRLLEGIGMIWDYNVEKWMQMYKLAKEYYKEHGNLQIPDKFKTLNGYKYNEDGVNLGRWIGNQRMAYKNRGLSKEERMNGYAPLTDEQVTLLENIGMAWDVYTEKWMQMYKLAQEYYREYGNLQIPEYFKTINGYEYNENGVNLGLWIGAQRKVYKNRSLSKENRLGSESPLTDEQVTLLENIGMVWDVYIEKWMQMYKLAQEYHREYGNLKIPRDFKTINGYEYNENGVNLGIWINTQRTAYKNRSLSKEERNGTTASLTDEQVRLLEGIGMIWDIKKNKSGVLELCSEYNIDIKKNKTIIDHISYTEFRVKILYLKDNNMPIEIDGILHEIFSMSSMNMRLKYNVSLEDLVNIYMKGRSL